MIEYVNCWFICYQLISKLFISSSSSFIIFLIKTNVLFFKYFLYAIAIICKNYKKSLELLI